MKNSIKKFVVACAAVTAVSAALSATAMAAGTYDATNNQVTVTLPEIKADTEATVLVLDKDKTLEDTITDADILYINQATNGKFVDGDTQTLKLIGTTALEEDHTYTVAIGYYKADGTFAVDESNTFTLGNVTPPSGGTHTVLMGDVNKDGGLSSADCTQILRYSVGKTSQITTKDQEIAADVNGDGGASSADCTQVLRKSVGKTVGATVTAGQYAVVTDDTYEVKGYQATAN